MASIKEQFDSMKNAAISAISSIFPVAKSKHKLELNKVWVEDSLEMNDYKSQLKSKNSEGTWGAPVYADMSLIDISTGKAIDRISKLRLFTLPKITPRGSFIVKGNEYQVANQLRLRPGVYTKKTKDDTLKTSFNLGKGGAAELQIDNKNILQLKVKNSHIPLYPLLSGMGISDSYMRKAWGNDLFLQNATTKTTPQKAVTKMSAAFAGSTSNNFQTAKEELQAYLRDRTSIDPQMTKLTIGSEHTTFSPTLWLEASNKLVEASKGDIEINDTDNLAYKQFVGIDDSIRERLEKNQKTILYKIQRNLDAKDKISEIFNISTFGKLVDTFFTEDDRSSPSEQTNPLHMLSAADKITFMGPGAITNIQQVSQAMRNLHPTHMSYIDPLVTPESEKIGIRLSMALGAEKQGNTVVNTFWDLKNKNYTKKGPLEIFDKNVAYPEYWDHETKKFLGDTIKVKFRGKPREVPASEVDYVMPFAQNGFSLTTNMIPFLGNNNGNRSAMAAKHLEQAVSLKNREAPLVQTQMLKGNPTSFESMVGESVSVYATEDGSASGNPISGKVSKITNDAIHIKSKNKSYKIPLYHNFPLNQKTFMHHTTKVGVGDSIRGGQLLADNNYTKDGVLALGTTLKAAYLPYKGYNFEDGIVISEGAAKKLTSEHIYKKEIQLSDATILNKAKFVANYPNEISLANRSALDDDGIIQKGATISPGDILVAALKNTGTFVGAELVKRRLNKSLGKKFRNIAETWGYDTPGTVTDVIKSGGKVTIFVKTEEPAQIGDKLCYDSKTEAMVFGKGWIPFYKITLDDKVATLNPESNTLEFHHPEKLFSWDHNGPLYSTNNDYVSMRVTEDHSLYCKKSYEDTFNLVKASEMGMSDMFFKKGVNIYDHGVPASFSGGLNLTGEEWSYLVAYATLLITEDVGPKVCLKNSPSMPVVINILNKHRIVFSNAQGFITIYDKELTDRLQVLHKELPQSLFNWDAASRHMFTNTLLSLQTSISVSGFFELSIRNKRIADQLQYLFILDGRSCDVRPSGLRDDRYFIRVYEEDQILIKKEDISLEQYHGKVYCCTVPNHILMVRREGKSYWCGNSGRHGNKGVITKIIPDAHIPHTKDGEPLDIILNPSGVISRMNLGQIYESTLGKISKKTGGEPYKVLNFSGENYLDNVKKEMADNKINDIEDLIDPVTKQVIKEVHVGNPYILKLNKQSEVAFSARGEQGPVSVSTEQPTSGGPEGAKALDLLTMYSLLSHGSRNILKEMSTYKSENNPEFWEAIKTGRAIPAPKIPYVFNKLRNMLVASGVDVKKTGSNLQLLPLTDKQVKDMSKMEIETPLFVRRSKGSVVESKGGFLDRARLGGSTGENWGHITLKEPTPNPIFEDAIKTITGLTSSEYSKILSGDKKVPVSGKEMTGGAAIHKMLKNLNVKREIEDINTQLPSLKGTALNKAIKKYRILNALNVNNIKPEDAYIRTLVPVIPPKFRPVSLRDDGTLGIDDTNYLYRNVALINQQLKLPVVDLLEDEDLSSARKELYGHMKGLAGIETIKMSGKDKAGFIETIAGSDQPKKGFFQNSVLKKNQNLVGRGIIIPEPQLHIDEMGMPHKMAWKLYAPFVIKDLLGKGYSARNATKEINATSPAALQSLERVMKDRPVLLNRAPSLHKASILAFRPKLTEGFAIKIPPLVTTPFNADFDGDTMTAHIPITDKAVREAYKMFPSRNLFKPGSGALMISPTQESLLGFYLLTKTPQGRATINQILPPKFRVKEELNKSKSKALFTLLSKSLPADKFSLLIDRIKGMGEKHVYDTGFTLGMKDLHVLPNRAMHLKEVKRLSKEYTHGHKDPVQFMKGYDIAQKNLHADLDTHYKNTNNALYEMVHSGARGNKGQLGQILASPMIVDDISGKPIPYPINKSFLEGLDFSDYWTAAYGARKGMIDRALETSEPGVLNKGLVAATLDNVISINDCGTSDGLSMPPTSPDVLGRYTQGNNGSIPRNTLITEDIVKRLSRLSKIFVRSPLKCDAPHGTCKMCYGVDESGSAVSIGDNIGVKAAQALAEPLSQGVMNTFHSGGVAGKGVKSGLPRITELLHMPKVIRVGKATLASVTGKVTKIESSGLKGFLVYINNVKHTTAANQKLLVSIGEEVHQGDRLTEGVISPQELLHYKGMPKVQEYLAHELLSAYKDQNITVDKKTVETVVRSMTNRTQITNNAKGSPWIPGDRVPLNSVERYNRSRSKGADSVTHIPYIHGIKEIPKTRQDWLAQMGATHVKSAIINGASQGWMSDLKGYHPIPAYAYGAEFGEGEEGRY